MDEQPASWAATNRKEPPGDVEFLDPGGQGLRGRVRRRPPRRAPASRHALGHRLQPRVRQPFRISSNLAALVSAASKATAASSSPGFTSHDFARAVEFLIARDPSRRAGESRLAPSRFPNRDSMETLREAWDAAQWGAGSGAPASSSPHSFTAPKLSCSSRAAASSPPACKGAGFQFEYPNRPAAAEDLVHRWRHRED